MKKNIFRQSLRKFVVLVLQHLIQLPTITKLTFKLIALQLQVFYLFLQHRRQRCFFHNVSKKAHKEECSQQREKTKAKKQNG